jgi:ribosomal protein S18 acetylase RimI-like enzyme
MNTHTVQLSIIKKENHRLFDFYINSIYLTISDLEQDYPEFKKWYYQKVLSGILEGKRDILCEVADGYIAGVVILKRDGNENKICTLRVMNQFQHRGIGKSLLLRSFDILNTALPLITVSGHRYDQFKKIFAYFGFKGYSELEGFYKKHSKEIIFNRALS